MLVSKTQLLMDKAVHVFALDKFIELNISHILVMQYELLAWLEALCRFTLRKGQDYKLIIYYK